MRGSWGRFVFAAVAALAWCGCVQAAPQVIRIDDFSKDYRATVTIDGGDADEVFRPGTIDVFDSRTGERLVEVHSDELAFDIEGGATAANVVQRPYGEQSVLIHDDFDFDGRKDLAIMDGQNSCYHGPSFQVYLANADGGFRHSDGFTRLAQDYCGMFEVDSADRAIRVMSKSGCCAHFFEEYAVSGGEPVLRESSSEQLLEAGADFGYMAVATTHGSGERAKTRESIALYVPDGATPSTDGPWPVLRFRLSSRPDREAMVLADPQGRLLDYVLFDPKTGDVEFSYALAVQGVLPASRQRAARWESAEGDLSDAGYHARLACDGGALEFDNAGTRYRVVDRDDRLGIDVVQGKRTTFIPGNRGSRQGSLASLRGGDWANMDANDCR